MDVNTLQLVAEVARGGSFAAAAKARGLDPSRVSRAVAQLEAELGVRLFQRSTRRLAPTEAGAVYLARMEPVLVEIEAARAAARELGGAPSGTLRLTASVSFGLTCIVPLLPEARARFPRLAIDCDFTDRNVDLVDERFDLAIRLAPEITGDLVAARLMTTRYHVVASRGYLTTAAPLEAPVDLARHRCLLFALRSFRERWRFRDAAGEIEEVAIAGDITIAPPIGLRDAARAGLGPTLLPDWLIGPDLAAGRLVDLFPAHTVTATRFDTGAWAVYPSRAWLPAKVRAFIDFLREALPRTRIADAG